MASGSGSGFYYDDTCPGDYIPSEDQPAENTPTNSQITEGATSLQTEITPDDQPMSDNHLNNAGNNAGTTIANLSLLSYALLGLLMK